MGHHRDPGIRPEDFLDEFALQPSGLYVVGGYHTFRYLCVNFGIQKEEADSVFHDFFRHRGGFGKAGGREDNSIRLLKNGLFYQFILPYIVILRLRRADRELHFVFLCRHTGAVD